MSDANKALMARMYTAIGEGNLEALRDMIADDLIEHEEVPGLEPTKDGVIHFFHQLRTAFPDLTMTPADMIAEGDKVFVRATMSGTHQGEFMGIPPTGKRIDVPIADFLRFEDGKLKEHWGVTDNERMMRQLGLLDS